MKKFFAKMKRGFSIFCMAFGGIGCAGLVFSLPLVIVSDDVDNKAATFFILLLTVALFAALFAMGVSLYGKKKNTETTVPVQDVPTPASEEPTPAETAPAAVTQKPAPAESVVSEVTAHVKETTAETPKESAAPSPYPQKNFIDADEEFIRSLAGRTLYTIYTEETHFVLTDLAFILLLFPKKEDAETYVRHSGQKALSVLELNDFNRTEILGACLCAGYDHAGVYVGGGIYQKVPVHMLQSALRLPDLKSFGIANQNVLPRFYSWLFQVDYTKRKQARTGEAPKEFWIRHLNESLLQAVAWLMDNPLTLPILWNTKGEPSVQALPVKYEDGRTVIHVFSDRFAVETYLKTPADCVAVPHLLDDILQNMKSHPEVDGVVLNPGRENIFIRRAVLEEAEYHKIRSRDNLSEIAVVLKAMNRLDLLDRIEESFPQNRRARPPQPTRQPTPAHRLYLMPVIFEGETDTPEEPDLALHIWPGAAEYLRRGHKLTLRQPLPEGMTPARMPDSRVMHGRLIKNPKTGMEFVPLYSTLDPIYKVYGQNVRLSVITFGEAVQLSRHFAGVILEPGANQHIILNMKP